MKLLDAVNLVMPKLGERPVTSLEVKHPTLAVILPIVDQKLTQCLLKGWWFNQYNTTVYPDNDGAIFIGADTLAFIPACDGVAVQRGDQLYNPETLSYVFTQPIKAVIKQYVAFDDLPEVAAQYVFYSALVEACVTDLGVTSDTQIWQTMAGTSYSDLLAEHLQQKKHTTRKSRRWHTLVRAMQG